MFIIWKEKFPYANCNGIASKSEAPRRFAVKQMPFDHCKILTTPTEQSKRLRRRPEDWPMAIVTCSFMRSLPFTTPFPFSCANAGAHRKTLPRIAIFKSSRVHKQGWSRFYRVRWRLGRFHTVQHVAQYFLEAFIAIPTDHSIPIEASLTRTQATRSREHTSQLFRRVFGNHCFFGNPRAVTL